MVKFFAVLVALVLSSTTVHAGAIGFTFITESNSPIGSNRYGVPDFRIVARFEVRGPGHYLFYEGDAEHVSGSGLVPGGFVCPRCTSKQFGKLSFLSSGLVLSGFDFVTDDSIVIDKINPFGRFGGMTAGNEFGYFRAIVDSSNQLTFVDFQVDNGGSGSVSIGLTHTYSIFEREEFAGTGAWHRTSSVAHVPIPPAGYFLLASLAALVMVRRKASR